MITISSYMDFIINHARVRVVFECGGDHPLSMLGLVGRPSSCQEPQVRDPDQLHHRGHPDSDPDIVNQS
jgi:hypothetical protein